MSQLSENTAPCASVCTHLFGIWLHISPPCIPVFFPRSWNLQPQNELLILFQLHTKKTQAPLTGLQKQSIEHEEGFALTLHPPITSCSLCSGGLQRTQTVLLWRLTGGHMFSVFFFFFNFFREKSKVQIETGSCRISHVHSQRITGAQPIIQSGLWCRASLSDRAQQSFVWFSAVVALKVNHFTSNGKKHRAGFSQWQKLLHSHCVSRSCIQDLNKTTMN